jgi:hypothetical protein
MTPTQRAFYEGDPRKIDLYGGRRGGRRLAIEIWIAVHAANEEQAALAIRDLRSHGVALMDGDGNRVESPGRPRFTIVHFDEGPKR